MRHRANGSSEPFNYLLRSTPLVCHNTDLGAQGIKGFTLWLVSASITLESFAPVLPLPATPSATQSRNTSRARYRHSLNHLITSPFSSSSFDAMPFGFNPLTAILNYFGTRKVLTSS